MAEKFLKLVNKGIDLVLPPRCPVSGEMVEHQGMVAPEVWRELTFISRPFCQVCGHPLEFEVDSHSSCMDCLENPPDYTSARSSLYYSDASRHLILGFKHGDKTHLVQSFLPWLEVAGKDVLSEADYVIPVPLHPYRLISRRYNQAALLSSALSSRAGIAHLPLALRRVRPTVSQGHLDHKARKQNVQGAFKVTQKCAGLLRGKKVILVDDVYTTGATVNECARALNEQGVSEVHVLTLAKVVNKTS